MTATQPHPPRGKALSSQALLAIALGTALIASSLAQAMSPDESPRLLNRTQEAIAGFQDLAPPAPNWP